MSELSQSIELNVASRTLRRAVELLSSMRFSISLLSVICIASVIGTVLKQGEPFGNYVNQFGPFWAEFFSVVGLYNVYSAWWFLLILAFLVTSTSLCIARNAPKIAADLKTVKENIREQSLNAFGLKTQANLMESPQTAAERIGGQLAKAGWKVKLQARGSSANAAAAASASGTDDRGWMVAARTGGANKLGYLAAHSAIVLVCLGGLLDGDLMVRLQMWFNHKTAYNGGGLISDVKPEHRLSATNPTFRANLLVAEGTRSSTAVLSQPQGVLIQDLPFAVELKKFVVEYYSTGMPKLFASDIVIHDLETKEQIPARVEVNHPANYKGVEIYQSSFDDGGSSVKLKAFPIKAAAKPFEVQGVIGGKSELVKNQGADSEKLTLEYVALRVINVENLGKGDAGNLSGAGSGSGADVRKVDLGSSLHKAIDSRLGAANKPDAKKNLRNVGPSVTYKLRDAAGQAREFHNYMLPFDAGDGAPMFLLGTRDSPADTFKYLRIPADENGNLDGFAALRNALYDPALRDKAVRQFAANAMDAKRPEMAQQLAQSAARALALFAGQEPVKGKAVGGIQAVADFIETNVPEAERAKAGEILVRILNGALYELAQLGREQAGMKPMEPNEKTQAFMTQAVFALGDLQLYPAPFAMQLQDFTQVQASVFQVARAPGKNVVYLGCTLLIVGIFAMLYVRERRVWVWLAPMAPIVPNTQGGSRATMALSSNRKTLDTDREFESLKSKLLGAGLDTATAANATNNKG